MKSEEHKLIKHSITRYLSRREHSCHELRQKLATKGFVGEQVDELINQFNQAGIQSEHRFVEMTVRNAINKGQGLNRVRTYLQSHHLPSGVIEQVINELDIDWFDLAYKVAQKKYKNAPYINQNERQKRIRFMLYRGFDHEQAEYALSN